MVANSIYRLARPSVQNLLPYQPGKPLAALARELGLANIIALASNENPLGPSPKAIAAVKNSLNVLNRYPEGSGYELKKALATKLDVDVTQITLGNGSNEILELIARTFLSSNLSAVFSQYAFIVYSLLTQAIGAQANVAKAGDGVLFPKYGHDLNALFDAITANTRIVFIANPNNPTGTFLRSAALLRFIRSLPDHVICVIDEAYFEYVNAKDCPDTMSWLASSPNLILTRTFSKAYGLAGLRVGYSISSPEIADLLNRVREPFNNNSLALVGALAALKDQHYLRKSIANNNSGMRQFTDYFKYSGLHVQQSLGNFIMLDLKRDALLVYQSLLEQGIIVRPIANYGLPTHLRISIGSTEANQCCMDALSEIMHV